MENETARTQPEQDRSRFLSLVGVGVALLVVVAPWLILRFAPAPVEVAVVVIVVLLVVLAVLGYVASAQGQGAAFVAIALVLPYLLFASVTHGFGERLTSEFTSITDDEDLFDDDFTEEDFFDEDEIPSGEGGTYGSDPVLDALHDDCVDGDAEACEELYLESPMGSEYESVAIENGAGG